MNARGLRRYVDDLLRGRRPKPFQPDDFDAAQIRTAIDLRAARLGGVKSSARSSINWRSISCASTSMCGARMRSNYHAPESCTSDGCL